MSRKKKTYWNTDISRRKQTNLAVFWGNCVTKNSKSLMYLWLSLLRIKPFLCPQTFNSRIKAVEAV